MHIEKEIEFKNLLTKKEFDHLLKHFQIAPSKFQTQINYYFDTPTNYFKEHKIGFRLRVLPSRNELTLKVPANEYTMNESTIFITDAEKEIILKESLFPNVPFLEPFKQNGPLTCIGSMQTNRAQIHYENGTLFFDHSIYSQTEDFEVEYECNEVQQGKKVFLHLLDTMHIPLRHTDKKIARLVNYLNTSKG